jgi:hypothetical protein
VGRPSKEHILREIRRLAEANDGTPLGKERFETLTGITEGLWRGRYWARWSDAVREAGFEPNTWQRESHDDDTLIRIIALLVRDFGYFPTTSDLKLRRQTDRAVPDPTVISRRFGTKPQQIAKVLAFADADPDFADIAAICGPLIATTRMQPSAATSDAAAPPVTGVVYMIRMDEFYKIGRSNDIDRRTRELRIQLPVKEELVHTIDTDDPSGIEAYWHKRFASRRANGEWFQLGAADVEAFQRRTYM